MADGSRSRGAAAALAAAAVGCARAPLAAISAASARCARVTGARAAVMLVAAVVAAPVSGQVSPASERRAVDRAERLREAGQHDEARAVLDDLLGRAPTSVAGLEAYAALARDLGDPALLVGLVETAAAGSGDAAILDLFVEALLAVGNPDSALAVARRWVASTPDEERAYLALAAVQAGAGDAGRALRTLEEIPPALSAGPAVLARRADLAIELESPERALGPWADLLAREEPRIEAVEADLAGLGPERAQALSRLVDALAARGGSAAAAGAHLALRLSEAGGARRLAGAVPAEGRADFLREYTRVADEAGLPAEVAWAAGELVALSPRPVDRLRWRAMSADRALAAGDTSAARDAFRQLASETEPGDGPHGTASRRLFSLLAADPARLTEAEELLGRFATEYPDSTAARAHMYGELAIGRARAGDPAGAEGALTVARRALPEAAEAPVDAAGAILAFYRGDRDSAVVRAGRALGDPDAAPDEQTRRLRLLTAAQAIDDAEAASGGAIAYGLLTDPSGLDPGGSLRDLAGTPATPGRPVLLAYLAALAEEAGRDDIAAGLRRSVVDGFPASGEVPAVLLDLARAADTDEARAWLERLIVGYPESALAPTARRMLSELDGSVRSGGGVGRRVGSGEADGESE